MNQQDVKYLGYIKNLVYLKKRRFEVRPDRDYLNDLLNLGITPLEAWEHILSLNKHLYFVDPKPNYFKDGKSLTFKFCLCTLNSYLFTIVIIIIYYYYYYYYYYYCVCVHD